ncbi:hypothetical protein BgiMline_002497, partial [Biomphalaria glabrata]
DQLASQRLISFGCPRCSVRATDPRKSGYHLARWLQTEKNKSVEKGGEGAGRREGPESSSDNQ